MKTVCNEMIQLLGYVGITKHTVAQLKTIPLFACQTWGNHVLFVRV